MPKSRGVSRTSSIRTVQYTPDGTIRTTQRRARTSNGAQRQAAVQARRIAALTGVYTEAERQHEENEIVMEGLGGLDSDAAFDNTLDIMNWVDAELGEVDIESTRVRESSEEEESQWQDISSDEEDLGSARAARKRLYSKARGKSRLLAATMNWESVYPELVVAYLEYDMHGAPAGTPSSSSADAVGLAHVHEDVVDEGRALKHAPMLCISLFDRAMVSFTYDPNISLSKCMVRHGYMPTSPLHPEKGISIRVLELYRVLNSRSARLGIEAFARTLCDLHMVAFRTELSRQLSQAFDAYMEILHRIEEKLDALLYPSTLARYQDMCPCCTYKLDGEEQLKYSMLFCIDGNESLRRHQRVRQYTNKNGITVMRNIERPDNRVRKSHLFVEADTVDLYKDEVKRRGAKPKSMTASVSTDAAGTSYVDAKTAEKVDECRGDEPTPVDGIGQKTPCVDRWAAAASDSKKKMWGTFDETGIFLAACRHGVVMLLCDMLKSGELAKYPLALISSLIDIFGKDLLGGYDIGCAFSTTACSSKRVGPKMDAARCKLCCNAFHGYAHNRKCQLQWHPLYIEGTGLEDFEGCERVFSDSNNVARPTRYASKFHRRQAILLHFSRWNMDKYTNLSRFLANNYKQALRNIADCTARLAKVMPALDIADVNVFRQWHVDEFTYLSSLREGRGDDETQLQLQMEYVGILRKLEEAEVLYQEQTNRFINIDAVNFHASTSSRMQRIPGEKSRGLDSVLTLQVAARSLEQRLGIVNRWDRGTPDWATAEMHLVEREYEDAINRLEGLVVARLFELSKMNKAGTGYKLRRHVAKALKARSKAVATAVKIYNEAATKLRRPLLDVDTVLNYVFLGQFDLLRSRRSNIFSKPWTRQAEREASVTFFKLERSHEEIRRLDIEIRRLHAYICDFNAHVNSTLERLKNNDDLLAFQLQKKQQMRQAANAVHLQQLTAVEEFLGQQRGLGDAGLQAQTAIVADESTSKSLDDQLSNLELEEVEAEHELEIKDFNDSLDILSHLDM